MRRFAEFVDKVDSGSADAAEEAYKAFLRETTQIELQVSPMRPPLECMQLRPCIHASDHMDLAFLLPGQAVCGHMHSKHQGAGELCQEAGAAA